MLSSIQTAQYVIADITNPSTNVSYEAGYAHGLGKTPIYVARFGASIPFDIKDYPVIFYSNMRELKSLLAKRLQAIRLDRKRSTLARDLRPDVAACGEEWTKLIKALRAAAPQNAEVWLASSSR
jgi:hypothetical protein